MSFHIQGLEIFLKTCLGTIALLLVAGGALLDLRRFNEDEGAVLTTEPTEGPDQENSRTRI